jgi:hypothetical protein
MDLGATGSPRQARSSLRLFSNDKEALTMSKELLSKLTLLTLLLFALFSTDFVSLRLSDSLQTAPWTLLLAAFLDACFVTLPILRSRLRGWRLMGAVFLAYYGLKFFQVGIEILFLGEIMAPGLAERVLVNGAVIAAIFSPVAILVHQKMAPDQGLDELSQPFARSWIGWAWRLAVLGVIWVMFYIAFGALVFQPIARATDPVTTQAYLAEFTPQNPMAFLFFQLLRGAGMALLVLPLIRSMQGNSWETALAAGLLFAGLQVTNLLLPSDLPAGMQIAHLAEVSAENLAFGLIVVGLMGFGRVQREKVFVAG